MPPSGAAAHALASAMVRPTHAAARTRLAALRAPRAGTGTGLVNAGSVDGEPQGTQPQGTGPERMGLSPTGARPPRGEVGLAEPGDLPAEYPVGRPGRNQR